MNHLCNLSGYSSGEIEAAIYRELTPVAILSRYPDWQNQINEPDLPIAVELPPRRSYGVLGFPCGQAWFFRHDTSYTVVTNIPLLQRQVEALLVLSCDDLCISSETQVNGRPARLIKFNNLRSLTLLATVLHHEAATLLDADIARRPQANLPAPDYRILLQLNGADQHD
jgi:hypothetical protein